MSETTTPPAVTPDSGMVTVSAAELVAAGLVAQRAEEAAAMLGETLLRQEARARRAERKLTEAGQVIGNFLAEYGHSEIPMFRVGQDLANSIRKILNRTTGGEAAEMNNDRPAVWSGACSPGGWVCAVPSPGKPDGICGMPVESEPCSEHRDPSWRPE